MATNNPVLCSKHFTYEALILCGQTLSNTQIDNTPKQAGTWQAIASLTENILDPVYETFGPIELTYGFCSHKLGLKILKNQSPGIAPKLDQHAGYELNSLGKRICDRGGMACDFRIPGYPMGVIAKWVVENCPFDRLYFYGDDSPLHVSHGPDPEKAICVMRSAKGGIRRPCRYTVEKFLELVDEHDT